MQIPFERSRLEGVLGIAELAGGTLVNMGR
jgi:hypothetical protein